MDCSRLEHFHTWCIGWSAASAVQLGFGNETAVATEVTETLPQALKRDPRIDGSYARLKACSTDLLCTRCETAIAAAFHLAECHVLCLTTCSTFPVKEKFSIRLGDVVRRLHAKLASDAVNPA